MVEIGELAPDFTLRSVNGDEISLRRLVERGRVLLVFYRGSWCPRCNAQIAGFEEDRWGFEELGIQLVGISTDDMYGAEKTRKKTKAGFPLLLDPEHEVIDAYEVRAMKRELKDMPARLHRRNTYAMPSLFLVDEKGVVRYRYVGRSFTDRPGIQELLRSLREALNVQAPPAAVPSPSQ